MFFTLYLEKNAFWHSFFAKKFFYAKIKLCESREEREYKWGGGFRNNSSSFCLGRPIIPFFQVFITVFL